MPGELVKSFTLGIPSPIKAKYWYIIPQFTRSKHYTMQINASQLMSFLLLVLLSFGTNLTHAQCKEGKKREKALTKEGWKACVTCRSLASQFCKTLEMTEEVNEQDRPKYLSAEGTATARTETAAKLQAIEIAKMSLAGQITNEIKAVIDLKVGNDEIGLDDAESITKMVSKYENVIITNLSYVQPKFVAYREQNNTVQYRVRVFYDQQEAMDRVVKQIRKKIRDELEAEADAAFEKAFGKE